MTNIFDRRHVMLGGLSAAAAASLAEIAAAQPGINPTVAENAITTGVSPDWFLRTSDMLANNLIGFTAPDGGIAPGVEGYADRISVDGAPNSSDTISFHLRLRNGVAGQIRFNIFRLGYYGGVGARYMNLEFAARKVFGQSVPERELGFEVAPQPTRFTLGGPLNRTVTANWSPAATFSTAGLPSGIYLAQPYRIDPMTGEWEPFDSQKYSYIYFIVTDSSRRADLIVACPTNNAQAYNNWGGYSLYNFNSRGGNRARQVSFNRPFSDLIAPYFTVGESQPGNGYVQMIRHEHCLAYFLERQGYDVAYISDHEYLDATWRQQVIEDGGARRPKVLITVGHSEYWTQTQRDTLELARDTGINLMFLGANIGYWRVRYPTTDLRTMECYKQAWRDAPNIGSTPEQWRQTATNTFRNFPINQPENALLGIMYTGDDDASMLPTGAPAPFQYEYNPATLPAEVDSIAPRMCGWEWDALVNNGQDPVTLQIAGRIDILARSPLRTPGEPGVGTAPSPDLGANYPFEDKLPLPSNLVVYVDRDNQQNPIGYELGFRFIPTQDGVLTGVKYYRAPGNANVAVRLWDGVTGAKLAEVLQNSSTGTEPGYYYARFTRAVRLQPNRAYVASITTPGPYAAFIMPALQSPGEVGPLRFDANPSRYGPIGAVPQIPNTNGANYLIQPDFAADSFFPNGLLEAQCTYYELIGEPFTGVFAAGSIIWAMGLDSPPAGAFGESDPVRIAANAGPNNLIRFLTKDTIDYFLNR